jgi:tight adherence protein B
MHPVVYALAILAALFGAQAILSLRTDRSSTREASRRRLDELAIRLAEVQDPEGASLVRGENPAGFGARLRRLVPRSQKLDGLIYRAGAPMSARQFYMATLALSGAGLFAGYALFGGGPRAIAIGATGAIPTLLLLQKQRRRMGVLEGQLPEALDLIARALRAGHSLSFGLQMVADEMPDPVGTEFGQAARQIALGLEPRVAIAGIADRIVPTSPSS